MSKFFLTESIKFQCLSCGKCCDVENGVVYVTREEQLQIAEFLKLDLDTFRRKYLFRNAQGTWEIKDNHPSKCRFLLQNRCMIYPVRPIQCRLYPFWSTILTDPQTFYGEACPGIGRGEPVDINLIKSSYVLHRNFLNQLKIESNDES